MDVHTVLLCLVLLWYKFLGVHMIYVPIFLKVGSLALWQSCDSCNASAVTLKVVGEINSSPPGQDGRHFGR